MDREEHKNKIIFSIWFKSEMLTCWMLMAVLKMCSQSYFDTAAAISINEWENLGEEQRTYYGEEKVETFFSEGCFGLEFLCWNEQMASWWKIFWSLMLLLHSPSACTPALPLPLLPLLLLLHSSSVLWMTSSISTDTDTDWLKLVFIYFRKC